MDMIFVLALLLFVAISVVWSVFVRKLLKTRIRSISVIVCVVLALVGTIILKNVVLDATFIDGTLLPLLSPVIPPEASDFINASVLLREVALGLPVALISPIVFVVLYTVLLVLASIVYSFIILFAGRKLRKSEKNSAPYAKTKAFAWSACSALLSLVVLLLPLAFYGGLVNDIMAVVTGVGVMDEKTNAVVSEITDEYVTPITNGTAVQIFRVFGGDAIIDELTSFPLKGETVYLRNEMSAIANLAEDIMPLVGADGGFSNFGEEEADNLVQVVDSLTKSQFLTAVGSEVVYFVTDGMVNGDEPMLMADNELFGGLITKAITTLHNDAKDTGFFAEDLKTVAEMVSALIKGGVLSNMSDTDALMEELSGGDTIKNVILALGRNKRMKALIPEVTNIGIEAIASFVDVKADANEAYMELLNTVAADLNSVKNIDDGETQISKLSAKLLDTFDHAGIVISKTDIDLYSTAMIEGIVNAKGDAEITADDVQNFFATTTAVDLASVQNLEAFEKATLLVFLDDIVIDADRAAYQINDNNVAQEAEAIGGIFSQAGTLLNDVSGEINIGDMAESVGGILNSLSQSVCVGQERTSKLFIAIVQSGIVRDAANMNIATATDLGTKGAGGDYAKTFKTISNTMDVLQNMNSSGGLTTEDINTLLQDITPETAGMIESYISEERLTEDYDMNKEQAELAAPMISDVFNYLGSKELTEDQRAKESDAISDVMNLATHASDRAGNAESEQPLFGGEEDSILGKDATGTVETIMASGAVKESLNNNTEKLAEGGLFSQKTTDGEVETTQSTLSETEKGQLIGAMSGYYYDVERPENQTEENKVTLTNLGKLFGLNEEDMKQVFNQEN